MDTSETTTALGITGFMAAAEHMKRYCTLERRRKPSVDLYKETGIKPLKKRLALTSTGLKGQFIQICAENGIEAEIIMAQNRHQGMIEMRYWPNIKNSVEWLATYFNELDTEN